VFEDMEQPSSDTEGKVAVGGNATFSNYSIGAILNNSYGTEDVLVVGGYLLYNSGAVYNGNVVYGDSTNLPQDNVSITGGTLRRDTPINFSHAEICLQNLSQSVSNIAETDSVTFEYGKLTLAGDNPFANVFHVNGSDLSNANDFEINVPNGSVVLVNISGTDVSWTGGAVVNGTAISNVLYNFYEAGTLYIQGIDVRGSVLAPYADLDFPSGVVNGQVIVKSMASGSGQFNAGQNNATYFNGNLPGSSQIINLATIIEFDQDDSDSTNNSSSVEINVTGSTSGSNTPSDDEDWDYVGSFGLQEMIWSMTDDNSGNKLIGTVGGKIYRSEDDGLTWELLNDEMNVGWIWDLEVDNSGNIYAATEQGLFISLDNGASWSEPYPTDYDVRTVEVTAGGTVYAGTWGYGILRKLSGQGFEEINEGLTSLAIQSLAIDSNGNIYAGTFGNGVMKSTDNGSTWAETGLDYDFVWAVDVNSNDEVYAGTYGGGVYKSDDGGTNWQVLNDGLNSLYVYNISIDENDNVYLSTWTNGIYMIEANLSQSWNQVGMNGVNVSSIMYDSGESTLYIATSSGSIYKKTDFVTAVNNEPISDDFELSQNYPNPFNPSTTIKYTVAEAGLYTVNIYSVIGEKVQTLVSEFHNAGNYEVNFNASNLASGIYIYQLKGNNILLMKKMILLK
ncbi:MAG: choice-of-anchor A family protein, partial [Ignavibacteria bacterium]